MLSTGAMVRALADAQLLLPNGDDVALHQLPTAARLGLPVDAHGAFGEQHLGVRSSRHDVGQLQELPEPDDVVPGDDFPHAAIIAHPPPSASLRYACERIQTDTCAGCIDRETTSTRSLCTRSRSISLRNAAVNAAIVASAS